MAGWPSPSASPSSIWPSVHALSGASRRQAGEGEQRAQATDDAGGAEGVGEGGRDQDRDRGRAVVGEEEEGEDAAPHLVGGLLLEDRQRRDQEGAELEPEQQ